MDKPNVIPITTDQHRGDCIDVDGNPSIQTPHLDRLAYTVSLVKGFCPVPVRVYAHFGHGFRTSQNTSVAHGQNPIRHR